ncbi:MAG: M3 family metallopeptidase [Jatrophihabitantaceae bacterium]
MTVEPLQLPSDESEWPAFVADRADTNLARARELIATLKDGTTRDASAVLDLWNDCDLALRNAGSLVSVLAEVHPDEAVRTLAEARQQEVSRLTTDRGLDRDLFEVLAAVDASGLDAHARRLLAHTLRDFRRSGVDRSDEVRTRLREISERSTVLGQDFSRNIRDDVRSIAVTPDRLAGLPQDFIDAHPPGDDGLVVLTTDYPDYIPFRTFAADADARRELAVQFLNRAWPQNDELLSELLSLRAEQAELLGYPDWPALDSEVKMVKTGAAIAEFIEQIATLAEPSARRDFDVLLERRRQDDPGATTLDSSNSAYYAELIRRERLDVDAQQVRRYFDFAQVRAGLLDVTGRLFGLEYRPVEHAPVWDKEVVAYDVFSPADYSPSGYAPTAGGAPIFIGGGTPTDGAQRGRIYLDLHPRDGKFKHAAQFDLVAGVEGRQMPEGVLVCNFPRGLMEHSDVVTLFHEFGHLVHHVLAGRQRWARFSGVATEWDFVEAPSQMLEEWAWDADILRSFAFDEDGGPIPADLVARMRDAKEFGKGYFIRMQTFYTALSYLLHVERPADITAKVRELQERYDLFSYLDGTHFHTSFGHLEGYTSAYYTYMWSLVIAKDMFSAFDSADLFDRDVAYRYRDRVLAPGGREDAAALVADFLGRPYSIDAFGRWLATAPSLAAEAQR